MKNVAFIINPKSSHKNLDYKIKQIKKNFPKSILFFSTDKDSTKNFIQNIWENVSIFVAVGGDGTVSSVASELINTEKILAIFPSGSGNGFARETGFGKDIDILKKKLKNKKYKTIDTFVLNENFGINASGVGFDAYVAKQFEKTHRGFWSYVKVCIRQYYSYSGIHVQIEVPNYPLIEGDYFFVTIANSRQFGNNAYIAPLAKMNDGKIEIVLVKKIPWWRIPFFVLDLFLGTLQDNSYVKTIRHAHAKISSNSDIWHIDGDYIKLNAPVSVRVQEKSLHLLV